MTEGLRQGVPRWAVVACWVGWAIAGTAGAQEPGGAPTPGSEPAREPGSGPGTAPASEPGSAPESVPGAASGNQPAPGSAESAPEPASGVEPDTAPAPTPAPSPASTPTATPTPAPGPTPGPTPAPSPASTPTATPTPAPAPAPAPTPAPTPAPPIAPPRAPTHHGAPVAPAPEPDPHPSQPAVGPGTTTGPALSVGVGHGYAGYFGGQLGLPIALPGVPLQLAPYVALGELPGRDQAPSRVSLAGGAQAFVGTRHRGFLDIGYGALATRELTLYGYTVAVEPLYAVAAALGYEHMAEFGLFLRAAVAGGILVDSGEFTGGLVLGLGWKPW